MATKFKNSVEIDGYLSISSGNWIQVPDGTTAQRPGSPQVGMFRYNTTTAEFEGYFGSPAAWGAIGGGGGGGTVTEAFKTFAVSGQSDIVADGPTDTLTVAAGNNISLTTDAATDTLTIASTASGGGTVTIQRNNYTGDGSTVAYGVSSTVVSENNIQIYLDGVYQDKDTFTATGTTVTFGTAPPATTEIEIMHYVAVDGVIEVDEFVGDGTTTNFATSLSIINEDATQVYVSGVYQSKLTYQTTGNVVSFTTAPPNGANIEIVHIKALALSGFNKNNFVGTGSQTAFTLNTTVNEENMTFVFLEGIYQDKSTYGISGSTLTFATAPQNGYNVEVMVLGAISASTNALYTDTFTGDGTETDYTLGITPVDLNAIEVYLNGLYQNVATLTLAANVVTFATPPPSGVIIEIRSVGFLNSGGTLAPATLIGGTGIDVITNSPNNFTINNTLIDVTVSYNTPTGQSLTYTTPSQSSGQAGSVYGPQTFTITGGDTNILSGTASISGLPNGLTIDSQSYNNTSGGNILTITLGGVFPSSNILNINLTISGLINTPAPIPVDYLVVAGGGGGGYSDAGGGGAGGLRTSYTNSSTLNGHTESTLNLLSATNYTVTVGAGGTRSTSGTSNASNGGNSVFSTITSTGGGYGAERGAENANNSAQTGGCGGGGASVNNNNRLGAAAVTSPVTQGYAGGNGVDLGVYQAGGGGGTNGVGVSASGQGGPGLEVNIIGTTGNYYGGGGGGGSDSGSTSNGGTGGGGNGGRISVNATSGSSNTGGGAGGGGGGSAAGGDGGSGIVILRYSNAYTVTIGSGLTGTTATDGSDKVTTLTAGTGNIQFN